MPSPRSLELHALARRVADAFAPELVQEVVLTGSVSRGVADELSDVELLLVGPEVPLHEAALAHAEAAGLAGVDAWSRPEAPVRLVGGYLDGVGIELVWWSHEYAEERVRAILAGEVVDGRLKTADALVHGVPLRTVGLLAAWQQRLGVYPDTVVSALVEDAALMWGGYRPAGLLTITRRPGERLALEERLLDDAHRVLRIVFAVNRVWEPTAKRLAARLEPLALAPPHLAERLEGALVELDPRLAMLALVELALEALELAPSGPYADRARGWLAEGAALLREPVPATTGGARGISFGG